jgi:phospholipase C
METRRQFLKKAALLSGTAGVSGALLDSIQRALAIEPELGSSYLDAEHIVILMQENRSFDHAFGALRGVRGFNDPRAITLPDGNPVWVQTNAAGESYVPFRLNIKDTRSTWMGCLPHNWTDQVDARNQGRFDRWLDVKRSGEEKYADMPLTLGYCNRQDIPFYYELADAFTICDQNFCSCLTGTTPNRLHLWTGTIRAEQSAQSPANVLNSDADYATEVGWTTFPERLEDHGIAWKIYQNELWVGVGFQGEEDPLLANFGDNPIEYFTQFKVRMSAAHRRYLEAAARSLPGEIADLKRQAVSATESAEAEKLSELVDEKTAELIQVEAELPRWNQANFDKLSPREKSLHAKAFCTNEGDPFYHELTEFTYRDGDVTRSVQVPKGDLLHQFRRDVAEGKLPTVSWVVAPERFSDHPCSAWFGAWYIAELLDILTQNPAVWKKTIFLLTYDENDGYFDHVPPFVAPHPRRPETGLVSRGIDTSLEYVEREQELVRKPADEARDSPIGLGYRVPMIIASPWSRGGCVCSQVFDHTSPLQFLEKFLSNKTGKLVQETNINRWRRTVCGDLTSAFQLFSGEELTSLPFPERDAFVEEIHRAQFKELPSGYQRLSQVELEQIRQAPHASPRMPHQEPGLRHSCPLPYELVVDGTLTDDARRFTIHFAARDQLFGKRAAGSPFVVYARHDAGDVRTRNYAVAPGDRLEDSWALDDFEGGRYQLAVYGPNGFFREFNGDANNPPLEIRLDYGQTTAAGTPNGIVEFTLRNRDDRRSHTIEIVDLAYENDAQRLVLAPDTSTTCTVNTADSFGWYDLGVRVMGSKVFEKRYAGRVETGKSSFSDPAMGRIAT